MDYEACDDACFSVIKILIIKRKNLVFLAFLHLTPQSSFAPRTLSVVIRWQDLSGVCHAGMLIWDVSFLGWCRPITRPAGDPPALAPWCQHACPDTRTHGGACSVVSEM